MKFQKLVGLALITSCCSFSTYAAEAIAKEDITPPAPAEAIAAEDVPPIMNITKANSQTPTTKPNLPNPDTSPASAPASSENRADKLMEQNVKNFF